MNFKEMDREMDDLVNSMLKECENMRCDFGDLPPSEGVNPGRHLYDGRLWSIYGLEPNQYTGRG